MPSLPQWLKNLIGFILGWGKCPGCRNTFWQNKIKFIPFDKKDALDAFVPICKGCSASPQKLDSMDVWDSLQEDGWDAYDALKACQAVSKFVHNTMGPQALQN